MDQGDWEQAPCAMVAPAAAVVPAAVATPATAPDAPAPAADVSVITSAPVAYCN